MHSDPSTDRKYQRIYAIIREIPKGRVATYGQIAELAGLPGRARMVGYALRILPADGSVPWHRVVNAQGRVSLRRQPDSELTQRMLLVREGVRFGANSRIRMSRYQWMPGGMPDALPEKDSGPRSRRR